MRGALEEARICLEEVDIGRRGRMGRAQWVEHSVMALGWRCTMRFALVACQEIAVAILRQNSSRYFSSGAGTRLIVELTKYLKALVFLSCGSRRGNSPDWRKICDFAVVVKTFRLLRLISNSWKRLRKSSWGLILIDARLELLLICCFCEIDCLSLLCVPELGLLRGKEGCVATLDCAASPYWKWMVLRCSSVLLLIHYTFAI